MLEHHVKECFRSPLEELVIESSFTQKWGEFVQEIVDTALIIIANYVRTSRKGVF